MAAGPHRHAIAVEDLGDVVRVGSLAARVIETPGHTAGHVVYWFQADKALFAGDTLFAMGCGRVFETPMAVMWDSLSKLSGKRLCWRWRLVRKRVCLWRFASRKMKSMGKKEIFRDRRTRRNNC